MRGLPYNVKNCLSKARESALLAVGGEFYISEYELAASRYYGDRYRLYRVYDFEKDPKVVIVKGCLDALIPVAKTYSIKLSKDSAHDD